MALLQCSVVAEKKMVRATNLQQRPSIRRQTIVNRSDVGHDLTALRLGLTTVVAQKEHKRPVDPRLNNAAVWSAVHIDACFAPGILVADMSVCRSAKRMTE